MAQKETKHIHRKVKCAHLVPEPDSRWRSHVVPGSKVEEITDNQPSSQPVPELQADIPEQSNVGEKIGVTAVQ